MKPLAALERRLGRFAIPNVTWVIVLGMAATYLLSLSKPEFAGALAFDATRVRAGEWWRLVTFVFSPPQSGPLWVMFSLYFTLLIGNMLEHYIGAFLYNLYWLVGIAGTITAGMLLRTPIDNSWLLLSGFLAFATVNPNYTFTLFFILPVAVKWLAMIDAAYLAYTAFSGGWGVRGAILAAFANYFIFFGNTLRNTLRDGARSITPKPVQKTWRKPASVPPGPTMGARSCAICGAAEKDGADIRVCACEKCGGKQRNLCLVHARAH